MGRKIYIVNTSCCHYSSRKIYLPIYVIAHSPFEAEGWSLKQLQAKYTREDGYSSHKTANAVEIPAEMIKEAYATVMEEEAQLK